jgi:hypothetical protein
MKLIKKISFVVVFLLLVEFSYLRVDPLSFGFPFRSVVHNWENFPEEELPPSGPVSLEAIEVDSILLVCDALVILLIGIILVRYVPHIALVLVIQGCMLGSVAGGIIFLLSEISPESWITTGIALIVMLLLVPTTAYVSSLRHKRQKTAILLIAFVVVITCGYTCWLLDGLTDGFMEDIAFNLKVVLRVMVVVQIFTAECFVIMLLHKRVLSRFFLRRRRPASDVVQTKRQEPAKAIGVSGHKAAKIKWAALYVSVLAIILYVGWHFATLRKMRHDEWTILDAVDDVIERYNMPIETTYVFSYPQDSPRSHKAGWKVSFPVEIRVDDELRYQARISKNILIPWIQVEIHKTTTATLTDEHCEN